MAKIAEPAKPRRRIPTQARADKTIEAILGATAHILRAEGEARLTTNRIAQRAGVSIGSVYQYFPNKEAILLALAERERRTLVGRVGEELRRAPPRDLEATARVVLRTLIETILARQKGRKAIILSLLRHRELGFLGSGANELAQILVDLSAGTPAPARRPIDKTAAFVLTRAIQGVLRAAVLEEAAYLGTPEFEDELVRLVVTFLRSAEGGRSRD